ncbi:MAG: MFS transporter [Oscillospiraceae bacterium]|nr:MFS transporter [Oscillospiraceae bacterium]
MAILTPEKRETLRYIGRHPVRWWRGRDLPNEQVRPWEQGMHVINSVTNAFRNAFSWEQGWVFTQYFRIPLADSAIANTIVGVFDALNDPFAGAFMDTKNFKLNTHRWINRLSGTLGPILILIPMLGFGGISHWQRLTILIICRCIADFIGTPAGVAGTKLVVHTTDDPAQRRKINLAQGLGETIHEMLVPLGGALIGLRYALGLSMYQILLIGTAIFTLPSILGNWGPTFIIQRLPDHQNPVAEEFTFKSTMIGVWEAFKITRHNKYFWLDNIRALLVAAVPTIPDRDFFRFSDLLRVLPPVTIGGAAVQAETILWARDNIVSIPVNFIVPFSLPIINKLGGPRNTQVLHESIGLVAILARALVGVNTVPRFGFHMLMEMCLRTFGRVGNSVAHRINQFEMLDYVEWKTGRRTEGATMAVEGLKNKLITNRINDVTGAFFQQFVLGFDPELGIVGEYHPETGLPQPGQGPTYLRWMPRMWLWMPLLTTAIALLSRILYKYPNAQREQVEADLAERRRLAAEVKARLEDERETVGVGFDD